MLLPIAYRLSPIAYRLRVARCEVFSGLRAHAARVKLAADFERLVQTGVAVFVKRRRRLLLPHAGVRLVDSHATNLIASYARFTWAGGCFDD